MDSALDRGRRLLNYVNAFGEYRPIRKVEIGHMPGEVTKRVVLGKGGSYEIGQGPVRMRVTQTATTENTIELLVEYDKAEAPGRAYYADHCDVIKGRSGVSLLFGKLKPGTSILRNKVEIVFPEEMFVRQLWKNSRQLHEKTREEFERRPLEPIRDLTDTDTVQAFRANNVMMVGIGDEALIDFYYIAPTEIHYALTKKRNQIALDPVIRIVLSGSLVFELLEKCHEIVEKIPNFQHIMEVE
jgi:hypothetical protein